MPAISRVFALPTTIPPPDRFKDVKHQVPIPLPPALICVGWFQERKKELVSIQGQLEARRAVFVESEKESKRREAELEGKLAVAEAQLCEVEAAAARTKEEQLKAVVAGSQAVSGIKEGRGGGCRCVDLIRAANEGNRRASPVFLSRGAKWCTLMYCTPAGNNFFLLSSFPFPSLFHDSSPDGGSCSGGSEDCSSRRRGTLPVVVLSAKQTRGLRELGGACHFSYEGHERQQLL